MNAIGYYLRSINAGMQLELGVNIDIFNPVEMLVLGDNSIFDDIIKIES